jgi:hypothetical protein
MLPPLSPLTTARSRAVTPLERRVRALVLDTDAPQRRSDQCGLRGKFVRFCAEEDCAGRRHLPLFPLDINKLLSFAIWLTDNGVSGWPSVKNYISAAAGWNAEQSNADCRSLTGVHEQLYARFRSRFQLDVPVTKRRQPKLDMKPELMEALALLCDLNNPVAVKDQTCYVFLYLSSVRVGHAAPATMARAKHVLTWGDVFISDADVFVFLHSTKTRSVAAADGWWTVLAARPHGHFALDPVRLFRRLKSFNFEGNTQPVFPADGAPMLAQPRTEFTAKLRRRLRRAVRLLPNGHRCPIERFTGISFRKAGVTQLWDRIPRHRLSAHCSHASFSSTFGYGGDTLAVRRGNTAEITSSFQPGF